MHVSRASGPVSEQRRRTARAACWSSHTWRTPRPSVCMNWQNRHVVQGDADSGAMKDLGKPGAGESQPGLMRGGTGSVPGSAEPTDAVCGQRRPRLPRQSPTLLSYYDGAAQRFYDGAVVKLATGVSQSRLNQRLRETRGEV